MCCESQKDFLFIQWFCPLRSGWRNLEQLLAQNCELQCEGKFHSARHWSRLRVNNMFVPASCSHFRLWPTSSIILKCRKSTSPDLSKKINPADINPDMLIGTYFPNLIAKRWTRIDTTVEASTQVYGHERPVLEVFGGKKAIQSGEGVISSLQLMNRRDRKCEGRAIWIWDLLLWDTSVTCSKYQLSRPSSASGDLGGRMEQVLAQHVVLEGEYCNFVDY